MLPARPRTRTARFGVERTNHQATAPIIVFQVPRMAWRVMSPFDLHDFMFIPPDHPEPSPGKRRRSTGRKKSSKSESEHDVVIAETVQEEQAEAGEG